jgi:hypothetical protein
MEVQMSTDLECPECGVDDLLYKEIRKKTPVVIQVVNYIGGLAFIGLGISVALDTGGLLPLVAILFGIFILWASLTGKIKDILTSVRFKCAACGHKWHVEIRGTAHAKKWQELPSAEWRKVVPGVQIPGLE